jgi:hypothetical protein
MVVCFARFFCLIMLVVLFSFLSQAACSLLLLVCLSDCILIHTSLHSSFLSHTRVVNLLVNSILHFRPPTPPYVYTLHTLRASPARLEISFFRIFRVPNICHPLSHILMSYTAALGRVPSGRFLSRGCVSLAPRIAYSTMEHYSSVYACDEDLGWFRIATEDVYANSLNSGCPSH